jgi:hypothetical protein
MGQDNEPSQCTLPIRLAYATCLCTLHMRLANADSLGA